MKKTFTTILMATILGGVGLVGCAAEGMDEEISVDDSVVAAHQSTFRLGAEELVVSADTWILDPAVELSIKYRRGDSEETVALGKDHGAPQEAIGYLLANASADFRAHVRQESELRKVKALEDHAELDNAESEERFIWAGHTWYLLGASMEEVPQHGSWCDCVDNLSCGLQGKPKANWCWYYLNWHSHCVSSC